MAIYSDPPTVNNFDPPFGAFRAMRPYPSRPQNIDTAGGTFEGVGGDSQDQSTIQQGSWTEHPGVYPRAGHLPQHRPQGLRMDEAAIGEQQSQRRRHKRVFDLVIDFGTSQSPKSTRPLTTYLCPSRPGHQALRNNFASSLLLRTWLPYDWTPSYSQIWCTADSAVPGDRSISIRSPSLNSTPWTTSASSL